MTEKTTSTKTPLLDEAERRMFLDEAALIEDIKRRRKLKGKEPGVPFAKLKAFVKVLRQEYEETGALNREHVEQLLRKLNNGEL